YVILHTKFRHFHRIKKTPSKKIKEILMIPGGAFNYRRLRKWVELLCAHGYRLKIFPEPWLKKSHKKILKRIYPALKFVGKVETRARPFFEADVALIPADRSAYEAAACGTPALYFCTGREQEYLADNFEKLGCGYKILPEKEDRDIVAQIRSLDLCQREEMGAQGKKTVDAGGVYRIIDFFQKKAII
ncbi:MAG: hypothetical protein KAT17_10655, partial [Candidatus Aminicenantes bacterium]|nr:hypothetical protein [Candidatus Aminicenantes bacterium]